MSCNRACLRSSTAVCLGKASCITTLPQRSHSLRRAAAALLKIAERAEAVVFVIKEPPRIIEWLGTKDRGDGLDARKH
jgi:hypothetical protein